MHERLLADLICPACLAPLSREALPGADPEREALLACAGGHLYPVAGGIPRLLPDAFQRQPAFARRFSPRLQGTRPADGELRDFRRRHAQVRDRFTFEWLRYPGGDPAEEEAIFFQETMWEPRELAGATVLDAGCGMGRFTRVAARHAGRVVACDLGEGLERLERDRPPNVDLVQCDLLTPPFRPASFERVYSLGVLHHTPDTFQALASVAALVAPGGLLSAWVYGRAGRFAEFVRYPWADRGPAALAGRAGLAGRFSHWLAVRAREATSRLVRAWTTGLPAADLYACTRLLSRLGRFGAVNLILPVSTHPDPEVRANDTFDWYAPRWQHHHTQAEAERWLARLGLVREATLSHGFVPKVGFRARRPGP